MFNILLNLHLAMLSMASALQVPVKDQTLPVSQLPETLLAVFKEVVVSWSCLELIILGRKAIHIVCLVWKMFPVGLCVRVDQMVGTRRDLCCSVFAESGGEYRLMLVQPVLRSRHS